MFRCQDFSRLFSGSSGAPRVQEKKSTGAAAQLLRSSEVAGLVDFEDFVFGNKK